MIAQIDRNTGGSGVTDCVGKCSCAIRTLRSREPERRPDNASECLSRFEMSGPALFARCVGALAMWPVVPAARKSHMLRRASASPPD